MAELTANDRQVIKEYLLGQLTGPDADRIEDRFVCESGFFDAYIEAERALVRDYAAGILGSEEAELFKRNYLITEERLSQLAVVKALLSAQSEHPSGVVRRTPIPRVVLAMACAALVFVAGIYWERRQSGGVSPGKPEMQASQHPPATVPATSPKSNTPTDRQQPQAREIFYAAFVNHDPPPPVHALNTSGPVQTPSSAQLVPVSSEAAHLGLRYNLVLVDPNSGKTESAAPDRLFHEGECFAIDFSSNRSGFLYVLDKQSDGTWKPLVPSGGPEMAKENNQIVSGQTVRVPSQHCFTIRNPPGVETLFVVLSREPRDSSELYESMRGSQVPQERPRRPSSNVQIASASVSNEEVERMQEQFGTRNIEIVTVSKPIAPAEPPESVYVVNSSNSLSSNLAAQIEIHHP